MFLLVFVAGIIFIGQNGFKRSSVDLLFFVIRDTSLFLLITGFFFSGVILSGLSSMTDHKNHKRRIRKHKPANHNVKVIRLKK